MQITPRKRERMSYKRCIKYGVRDHERAMAWSREINGNKYIFLAVINVNMSVAHKIGHPKRLTFTDKPRILVLKFYGIGQGYSYEVVKEFPIVRLGRIKARNIIDVQKIDCK